MLQKHVFKINPQYLGNILMKINSKLGGQNVNLHADLPMMTVPTILIGADVTHPTGFGARESKPSIVAVVASMDRQLAKYAAILKTQPGRVEEILDMRSIIKDLLRRFRQASNFVPKRIVFFRDGVSEGQFEAIFHREVREIKAACMELEPTYNPELTFIVVKKRHHIRFFPDQGTPTDRSGNVLPGTVVDNDIVHPTDFDFYMMSHAGIQGTSRPVHYYCLMDEIKFSSDKLQEFIYNLCYINARCTRSTSLPPPVYYAHLAAYRGRVLSSVDIWDSDTTVSSETARNALPQVTNKVTMFYI
jgi:eukaryotic translation initiation factor 2C